MSDDKLANRINFIYPKLYDTRDNCCVPTVLDTEQLLSSFDRQISWVVPRALQKKAMLT